MTRTRLALAALTLVITATLAACYPGPPYPPDVADCTQTKAGTWDCTIKDGSGGGGGGGGGGGW
jgi:hypothetical protein